ncbi:MAG TPA: carbohydrate kinase [Candidatus Obscuribacterales bacterium]
MPDVLCLGEILVDWVSTTVGAELDRAEQFTKAPGGAPANTAVGLARQGIATAFIGRVSDDEFGRWLKAVLEKDGIDTTLTIQDADAQTRMAYVVTTATGDRKLADFTKIACADARLRPEDLKEELFAHASVLHFGSISLIANPAADATRRAVELGRQYGLLISYDPNVRLGLWPSKEACREKILETLSWADIVKINEDELHFLTGSRELAKADELRETHNIPVLVVTLDLRGAYLTTKRGNKLIPGFQVKLVEATGAGDGFNSGVISGLINFVRPGAQPFEQHKGDRRKIVEALELHDLSEIIRRANAIGALTCTRAGAIPALPTKEEVDRFLAQMAAQTTV